MRAKYRSENNFVASMTAEEAQDILRRAFVAKFGDWALTDTTIEVVTNEQGALVEVVASHYSCNEREHEDDDG